MNTTKTKSTPDYKLSYDQKRTKISVSFNLETEIELYEYAKSLNFSVWVKNQLEKEMKKKS